MPCISASDGGARTGIADLNPIDMKNSPESRFETDLQGENVIDHIILTVINFER
jgi:hypothetical protein